MNDFGNWFETNGRYFGHLISRYNFELYLSKTVFLRQNNVSELYLRKAKNLQKATGFFFCPQLSSDNLVDSFIFKFCPNRKLAGGLDEMSSHKSRIEVLNGEVLWGWVWEGVELVSQEDNFLENKEKTINQLRLGGRERKRALEQ